jgi:hypothetical protein
MRHLLRYGLIASLEEKTNWNLESIRQLHKRGQSQILLAAFDRASERASEAALMRKLLLGPFPLLPQSSHSVTKVFADSRGILHPPYDQATVNSRPRSIVGRSVVGVVKPETYYEQPSSDAGDCGLGLRVDRLCDRTRTPVSQLSSISLRRVCVRYAYRKSLLPIPRRTRSGECCQRPRSKRSMEQD